MSARDHIETARRQIEGADRRIVEGKTRDARGVLSGAIAQLAAAQHELSWRDGYEHAQAEHEAQRDLDRHVRVMRGRDAIAAVLATWGWDDETATERANNIATALSDVGPHADVVADVAAGVQVRLPAHVACLDAAQRAHVLLSATTAIVTAWVWSERAPEAAPTTTGNVVPLGAARGRSRSTRGGEAG
ncbi:hypothetical protein L6R52_25875 [Myxococcota bacterium]|nr:hypothetical protein [Myxococcota bacterium]